MKKKENIGQNARKMISNMFELPKEVVYNLPLITIIGKDEMNIENFKGVIEYTDQKIRINTAAGVLKIEGKKLFLKQITTENILITGVITKFEYLL